ncbi:hypothetical protein SAMN05192539_101137 [Paraburkholderia diazotrophica]|uniref:Uncharacterized protein n=1 Tax=Paraburkholderia diazotrophica TaxID=667676 RepID=A0A1H6YWU6_9BURK|nr:hypothetical protein SAMN05192539_101137 [Paraburkholderia diazotrophica]
MHPLFVFNAFLYVGSIDVGYCLQQIMRGSISINRVAEIVENPTPGQPTV